MLTMIIILIRFQFDPYHPNMIKMHYSARQGEITIARDLVTHSKGGDAYVCRLNISNIAKEDHGEWKVVMAAQDQIHVEVKKHTYKTHKIKQFPLTPGSRDLLNHKNYGK